MNESPKIPQPEDAFDDFAFQVAGQSAMRNQEVVQNDNIFKKSAAVPNNASVSTADSEPSHASPQNDGHFNRNDGPVVAYGDLDDKLKNVAALIGIRVRRGIKACEKQPGRNKSGKYMYLRERLSYENLSVEEHSEFSSIVDKTMGGKGRTLCAIREKFIGCDEKYIKIFGRCVVDFLTESGEEDFDAYLNENKGRKAKQILKDNIEYKEKILSEYKRLFGV